jgi:hypothetical protein
MGIAPIVMGRKNEGLIREFKEFLGDRIELCARVATGEVSSPGTSNEEGVTGKDSIFQEKTYTIRGMSRGVQDLDRDVSHGDSLPILHVNVHVRGGRLTVHDHTAAREIVQLECGRAMVRMGVGIDNVVKL